MVIAAPLRDTLARLATAMDAAQGDWWIISGAAVALYAPGRVVAEDVDVLVGVDDARLLLQALGLSTSAEPPGRLFRSEVFARWTAPPLTIEFMAGLHVRAEGRWRPVAFDTRERTCVGGATVFVPSREELRRSLLLFGRPKDLERAALLG